MTSSSDALKRDNAQFLWHPMAHPRPMKAEGAQPDVDLSPTGIDNHAVSAVFEELVRKFNEGNSEEAEGLLDGLLVRARA